MPSAETPDPLVAMRRRIVQLEQGVRDIRTILTPVATTPITPTVICTACRDEMAAARRRADELLGYTR